MEIKNWIYSSIKTISDQSEEMVFLTDKQKKSFLTYKKTLSKINELRSQFLKYQISYVDRGVVCLERGIYQAQIITSLLALNCPAVCIETNTKKEQIIKIAKLTSSKYLILDFRVWEKIKDEFKDYQIQEEIHLAENERIFLIKTVSKNFKTAHPEDLMWLLHTSGSTGDHKLVGISSESIYKRTVSEIKIFNIKEKHLLINVLSFCHDLGLNQILTTIMSSSTLEINSTHFATDFVKRLQVENYNGITGMPNTWKKVISIAKNKNITIKNNFYMTVSGGSMSIEDILSLHSIFPNARIIKTYGQTETFRSLYEISNPLVPTSFAGTAYIDVDIELYSENESDGPAANKGELIHFGEGSCMGYWDGTTFMGPNLIPRQVVASKHSAKQGIRTGDHFIRNEKGEYCYLGRRDDLVKINGRRFHLNEVELCLSHVECVTGAVVCKIEKIKSGVENEALVAFVEQKYDNQATKDDLKKHCTKNLEAFKVPVDFVLLQTLPLLPNGKYDRQALIEKYLA